MRTWIDFVGLDNENEQTHIHKKRTITWKMPSFMFEKSNDESM